VGNEVKGANRGFLHGKLLVEPAQEVLVSVRLNALQFDYTLSGWVLAGVSLVEEVRQLSAHVS
jgi:hypothetical protein